MAKGPGRDQRAPMERLVRIAAVLRAAGAAGVPRDRLLEVAGFDGADAPTQLSRELRNLNRLGWLIDNVADAGDDARYRMTTVDNRLRVRLTPEQQTALRRAVLLADRDDLVERLGLPAEARPAEVAAPGPSVEGTTSGALSEVVRAVRDRCVLRFGYKGVARVVHPESLQTRNGGWYLRGVEDAAVAEGGPVKTFVVDRMAEPEAGPAGSASLVEPVRHAGLHPMTWQLDPPVDVVLRTPARFEPDVRRWLGEPRAVTAAGPDPGGEDVLLTYRVTNREALRARLYELGTRVRVVGPPEVRDELVAALAAAAGMEPPA
ncbi:WYL domain-containing protein [Pimelobacter simplex]|uniref:WYL domain-containing protein n=1 Tax=Nocardioides simplex TaxID=2045 RepID=UPI003AAFE61C